MDKKVLVLILNYNGANDAIACVESVKKSDFTNYTIALVDNFSTDNSLATLSRHFMETRVPVTTLRSSEIHNLSFKPGHIFLIANHENRGFAAGNNLVLSQILEWDCMIWLLNPDIIVEPNTMSSLVQDMGMDPIKVVGHSVFSMKEPERMLHLGGGAIDWKSATVRPATRSDVSIDYIYGGSLFTHSLVFSQFGLLPEQYFLYWEETDWCYRLKERGVPLVISSNARVYDKVGGSIGRGQFAFYYYTLNGLRFVTSIQPYRKYQIVFFNVIRILKRILSFQFQVARGIFWGTVDFLRGKFNTNGIQE